MQDLPDPHDRPISLRERLPQIAVQLDVAAISVLLRPVLAGAGKTEALHALAGFAVGQRPLPSPSPALQRELLCLGRSHSLSADDREHGPWLRAQGFTRLRLLCGPRDRLPCVFFLCFAHRPPRPQPAVENVALATIESLCARLAPPAWLPLAPRGPAESPVPSVGPRQLEPLRQTVEELERTLLRRALRVAEGNKTLAARSLCMTRAALYRKLRRYGLLDC